MAQEPFKVTVGCPIDEISGGGNFVFYTVAKIEQKVPAAPIVYPLFVLVAEFEIELDCPVCGNELVNCMWGARFHVDRFYNIVWVGSCSPLMKARQGAGDIHRVLPGQWTLLCLYSRLNSAALCAYRT